MALSTLTKLGLTAAALGGAYLYSEKKAEAKKKKAKQKKAKTPPPSDLGCFAGLWHAPQALTPSVREQVGDLSSAIQQGAPIEVLPPEITQLLSQGKVYLTDEAQSAAAASIAEVFAHMSIDSMGKLSASEDLLDHMEGMGVSDPTALILADVAPKCGIIDVEIEEEPPHRLMFITEEEPGYIAATGQIQVAASVIGLMASAMAHKFGIPDDWVVFADEVAQGSVDGVFFRVYQNPEGQFLYYLSDPFDPAIPGGGSCCWDTMQEAAAAAQAHAKSVAETAG